MYLDDVEAKFRVFDELASKIDLLKEIISELFSFKRLSVDKETGLTFVSAEGAPVELRSLSSGEQHELVLLYELLFIVTPNSLVLIDEPEMSLHVAWQQVFLRNLAAIARLSKFDSIIATHSPQIIADKWDLTIELKGPHGEANG